VHTDSNLKLKSGVTMFNQSLYCKFFIIFLLIWPINVMAATNLFKTPISLSGIIEPAETMKVQASVGGRVTVLHVKENQHVNKDQLLLSIKNDSQKRQVELSRLQLEINENNVNDGETQLELTRMQISISKNNVGDLETNLRDIKRRLMEEQTLFEQGSSTRSQYDSLQLQYSRGEVSLKNAILSLQKSKKEINRTQISMKNSQLALERSQQELEKAEEALEDTQLRAKIGGIIIGKSFEEGEVISPGAVLFQIINIKQVEIPILVDEADLPLIKEGQAVVFTTPSYRDKEFTGIIDRISWTSDPETGRFPLYVKAANPGLKLRAGMSAKVYLMRQK